MGKTKLGTSDGDSSFLREQVSTVQKASRVEQTAEF